MTAENLITVLASTGITGAVFESGRRLFDARRKRAEMARTEPDRVIDTSLTRAQQALLIMEGALKAAQDRAQSAETQVRELRTLVDKLEDEIDEIRTRAGNLAGQLIELRRQLPPA